MDRKEKSQAMPLLPSHPSLVTGLHSKPPPPLDELDELDEIVELDTTLGDACVEELTIVDTTALAPP
ncbi:hypothetical protein JYT28_00070 [Desulfobulbus sp. AH-315-M07]|nr:hypothetical protein [Desulfobulbus sp. AH-315-M07]